MPGKKNNRLDYNKELNSIINNSNRKPSKNPKVKYFSEKTTGSAASRLKSSTNRASGRSSTHKKNKK